MSDKNLKTNSCYKKNEILKVWTSKSTLKSCVSFRLCSTNRLAGWTGRTSSHTRLSVTGLKYHTIGCGALWESVSVSFSGFACLSLCHKISRSTLWNHNTVGTLCLLEACSRISAPLWSNSLEISWDTVSPDCSSFLAGFSWVVYLLISMHSHRLRV